MKQKGIAHLVLLIILAGVAAAGAAGFFVYKSSTNSNGSSDLGTTSQALDTDGIGEGLSGSWEAYDNAVDETQWAEDYVNENADIYDEAEQEADFAETKEKVRELGELLLTDSYCGRDLVSVETALELVSRAQRVGLVELGDRLFEWAKNAFIYNLSVVAPSWADDPSEEAMQVWLSYWRLAGMLGLGDLADMILEGNLSISLDCPGVQVYIEGTPLDKQKEILLEKDYCDADIEDIRDALKIVERLQFLNKKGDEDVMEWAKTALTAIIAENHDSWSEDTKAEYAALAAMLELISLSDDLQSGNVDLEDWYKSTCGGNAYSVNFGDVTLKKTIGETTQIIKYTNVKAHTCDGVFSKWIGTRDVLMETVIPGYPTQTSGQNGAEFSFSIISEDGTMLDGTQISVYVPMSSAMEGPKKFVGNYVKGSSECN